MESDSIETQFGQKIKVNCFTEWDRLESVIVGNVNYNCLPGNEPALKSKFQTPELMHEFKNGIRPKVAYENAEKEIDNFIRVLKNYNVNVLRPEIIDWTQPIETPFWKVPNMHGSSCYRDIITVIGNEIIESGMSWRCRFFEYAAYRKIIDRCLNDDPKCKWTAAPKPVLTDKAFRLDYPLKEDKEKRKQMIINKEFITTEEDIIFEAADIMRYGYDIFVMHGFSTNLKAIDWLRRNLSPNYRVHALSFPDDQTPIHLDATFVPIKPPTNERKGVIFNVNERRLHKDLTGIFTPSFDILDAPEPNWESNTPRSLCSRWLSTNVLHLDPSTIVVEETEKNMIKSCEDLGMKVIPIPFRASYEMGGSFHCHTTDLFRLGEKLNYFPHLDEEI